MDLSNSRYQIVLSEDKDSNINSIEKQASHWEEIFSDFFFPLYYQPKHKNKSYQLILWFLSLLELLSLSFFRIDIGSNKQSIVSFYIGFVDLSSLGLVIGQGAEFLAIILMVIVAAVAVFQGIAAVLYRQIITTQPWILTFLQVLVDLLMRVFYIPFIHSFITTFDCYEDENG
ncbi:MAG: hypothetical protein EZS28_048081, partial [Streblomastix strix]